MPVPDHLSVVHLTVRPDLKRRIRLAAARAEQPMTNWIRQAIERAVEAAEQREGTAM
jgi:predicted HicB family RNase H-like nuclease